MKRLINNPFGKRLMLTFIIVALITASCAKSTRTLTPLTHSNRSNVKKIAIFVEADEELDASVGETEGLGKVAAVVGTVVVFSLYAPGPLLIPIFLLEHSQEQKNEGILESKLIQFHPDELMLDRLKHYFESSNAGFTAEIPEVKSPSMLKEKGFDTILEINLKEWGLNSCGEKEFLDGKAFADEKAFAAGILLSGRMISIDNNSTVWEREELYKDKKCYRLVNLQTQPELLVDILSSAIQTLAENTVNEILYNKITEKHEKPLLPSRPITEVPIDIKPGDSDLNCINPNSKGSIPVAILGNSIDVSGIDVSTIEIDNDDDLFTIGAVPIISSFKDVNDDLVDDLIFYFKTTELYAEGLLLDGNELFVTGDITDGTGVVGSVFIFLAGGPRCSD